MVFHTTEIVLWLFSYVAFGSARGKQIPVTNDQVQFEAPLLQ